MGSKEKNTVPFNGTPEQEKALREMIGNHKGQQGALMPVSYTHLDVYKRQGIRKAEKHLYSCRESACSKDCFLLRTARRADRAFL